MQTYDVGISKSSVYRYLQNYLSIEKTDMLGMVKFKPRKQYRTPGGPKAVKIGRIFADFLAYIDEHGIQHWVEMGTVIGRVGGKAYGGLFYCIHTSTSLDFFCCNKSAHKGIILYGLGENTEDPGSSATTSTSVADGFI